MNTRLEGRVAPVVLVALVLLLLVMHWPHGPDVSADDHGQYLLHARALLEGRPYTDIGFLHSRYSTLVAPVAEPPGFPVLIAGAFAIGGESLVGVRLILTLALASLALLLLRYWRPVAGTGFALFVSAWTVLVIARQHTLDVALADLPFIAAWWAVAVLADREELGTRGALLMAAAGAMAFTFRMAALPLIPAAATMWLLRPRSERLGWGLQTMAWTAAGAAIMIGMSAGSALGSETLRSPATLVADVLANAGEMIRGTRNGLPVSPSALAANKAMHALLLALIALGLASQWRLARGRFAVVAAIWYVLMLLALPTRAGRYMWPLYPFLAAGCWFGLEHMRTRLSLSRTLTPVLATLLLAAGLARDWRGVAPRTFEGMPEITELRSFFGQNPPGANERVAFFSPRQFTWFTGIPSAPLFDAPPDTALAFLREHHIRYLVAGDAGTMAVGSAGADRLAFSAVTGLRPVYQNPTFRVFEVLPP